MSGGAAPIECAGGQLSSGAEARPCDAQDQPSPPAASNAAGWELLGLLVAVLVIELLLLRTGRPTISHWVKRHIRPRWRVVSMLGLGVLLWHVFFGGPI